MLYDPKWGQKTEPKADPFSREAFIAWLEKKPAGKQYNWLCVDGCAVGQYRKAIGNDIGPERRCLHNFFGEDDAAYDFYFLVGQPVPHTFGAALERARKLTAQDG